MGFYGAYEGDMGCLRQDVRGLGRDMGGLGSLKTHKWGLWGSMGESQEIRGSVGCL